MPKIIYAAGLDSQQYPIKHSFSHSCINYIKKSKTESALWGFVPIYLLLGLSSAFYHASATFVGQFLDFASIYVFLALILALTVDRHKWLATSTLLKIIGSITFGLLILLWFLPQLRIFLLALQILVFLIIELVFKKTDKQKSDFKNLYLALMYFFVAWGFWWLDVLLIWQDQSSMHFINGHALWHIVSALSLYFVYKFYADHLKSNS